MPAITDISTNSLKVAYPKQAVETMVQEDIVFRPHLSRDLPPGMRYNDGYELRFGARLDASNNVAQIIDGGTFPLTKEATDRQFVFKPTIFAGGYQISLLTRFVASSQVAAFNNGESARRPEEVMGNMGKLIESTYVGTDGTGIRGYVGADGANTITVAQPHGTRLFVNGYAISVRQSAGGAVRDSLDLRTVSQIDDATRTFTYSGADQTAVANDPIYVVPEAVSSVFPASAVTTMHANGMRGQIDDGSVAQFLHTLDRTAAGNSKLKSLVLTNGNERRNITESLLMAASHDTARRSKKRPTMLIMGEGQCEKYVEHVAPQKRFPAMGRQRPGKATGYIIEELSFTSPFGSMEFMLSFDALPGEIYGISWDACFFYSAVDAQWMTGDEASLHLLPATATGAGAHRAAWGAYLISVENWGTDFPTAHFAIRDLKDRLLGD